MDRLSQRDRPEPIATGRSSILWIGLALIAAALPSAAAPPQVDWQISERGGGRAGGELVVSLTAEPRTYLPLVAYDTATRAVVERMHASLVRRDGQTYEYQPALARSWRLSPDHLRLRLELRRGVQFSDGEPFDADDVVFTLRAVQDPEVGALQRDLFVIDGRPVTVEKLDAHTVELVFPRPHPTPLWLLNDFPILPQHRLGEALRNGTLAQAWPMGSKPSDLAGLGPFRLRQHEPGSHLTLERNPYYWRRDRPAPAGVVLPYLDSLRFQFVADETAKLLRFQTGDSHLVERVPGDRFDDLRRRAREGAPIEMRDLGPGLGYSFVVFNLNDVDLPEVRSRQTWFRKSEFRRALALAVDRPSIARIVYHGHASPLVSDLSPGNARYWDESLSAEAFGMADVEAEQAAALLRQSGLRRSDDGSWVDGDSGEPVSFTLVTNTSNSKRAATASLLQEDFRRLGLDVTFVGLEFGALVERLTRSFDYDLLLLEFSGQDLNPNSSLGLWSLDGASHFFHLGAQEAAFEWEADVDRLMRQQAWEVDPDERRRLVHQVQRILAREAPLIFLVAPDVLVGAHRGLGNFAPSILEHPTLWNADELYWTTPEVDPPGEPGR